MEQTIKRALDANPSIEAKFKVLESARMQVGVAQSYFWPRISFIASRDVLRNSGAVASYDDLSARGDRWGLQVNLNLFSGFQHLNDLQKSRIPAEVAVENHRQARLELIANIQLSYINLLSAKEHLCHVYESRERIETQLSAAKAFVKVGMAPHINILQNELVICGINEKPRHCKKSMKTR